MRGKRQWICGEEWYSVCGYKTASWNVCVPFLSPGTSNDLRTPVSSQAPCPSSVSAVLPQQSRACLLPCSLLGPCLCPRAHRSLPQVLLWPGSAQSNSGHILPLADLILYHCPYGLFFHRRRFVGGFFCFCFSSALQKFSLHGKSEVKTSNFFFFLSLSASREEDTTRELRGRKRLGSQVQWHMRTDFLSEKRQKTKTLRMLPACLGPLSIKSPPYGLNEPLNSRGWIIFPLFSAEESKSKNFL